MTCDLQPAPLEPTRALSQSSPGGHRIPLVDGARIEDQRAADPVLARAVGVAVNDQVGVRKAAPKAARDSLVRGEVAEAQSPQQRVGFFEPARPLAMD